MGEDTARWIDPFIGVDWPGNCLCGPHLPHSLVRLGPDTVHPHDTTGYRSGSAIVRFSHTHVAGTGGGGRYGNIGVMPFLGPPQDAPSPCSPEHEEASAGYYAVTLGRAGIRAELTSTPRVGMHRYSFPAGSAANVLIDVGAVIQVANNRPGEGTGASTGGFVEFTSAGELVGRGDFRGGWGHQHPYSVFFCVRFGRAPTARLVGDATGCWNAVGTDGAHAKAVASFAGNPAGNQAGDQAVELRVGISLVSVAQARASIDRETTGMTFDDIRSRARATWSESLARVRVEGGSDKQLTMFYTMLSRLLCMPTDLGIDDENPWWRSGVRHYSDFYCLWDSVRNANSLLALIEPELESALLNSLLDTAERTGWLPDAWIAGHSAQIQGASSADVLFCEAALKGLPGVDYSKALAFMRKNAEVEPDDPRYHGRHLRDWRDRGWLSTDTWQGVSRQLEYAYQDWCIGALARHLGDHAVAERYGASSRNLWNLWREDIHAFAPRRPDGSWAAGYDPAAIRPDCWADPHFYEGSGHAWSFNTQHDVAGLIARMGSDAAFIARLDQFFADGRHPWKEIVLHTPYLYTYAGRPDLTAERAREMLAAHYRPTRDGLDDNEDMGCQSAFYLCASIGIYPIMGQDLYLLSPPALPRVELTLAGGRVLVIEAPGAGPQLRQYIAAATLDGQQLDRAWLRHGEIVGGGTLRFTLSDRPGDWGQSRRPPSPLSDASPHAGKARSSTAEGEG